VNTAELTLIFLLVIGLLLSLAAYLFARDWQDLRAVRGTSINAFEVTPPEKEGPK
jgi:hypothetical protein